MISKKPLFIILPWYHISFDVNGKKIENIFERNGPFFLGTVLISSSLSN